MSKFRKTYFDVEHGQIHARLWHENLKGIPLLCLPPAPHTSLYFSTLARHLNYPIIAIDYPGSGASCPWPSKPNISDFASAIGQLISQLGKVHLLGFHTGCLVAIELSKNFGKYCDTIICTDVPLFDPETRIKYAAGTPDVLPPEKPDDLSKSFESTVTKWRSAIGENRALALWVESLRAGPRYNDIFQAAFAYDAYAAFETCNRDIEFIATTSSLLEGTRKADALCKQGHLTEALDIKSNVFEKGAPVMASILREMLS